jgi:hypothetical protein
MRNNLTALLFLLAMSYWSESFCQKKNDSTAKVYRNVIRYNLSGGLLFGLDKYIVFGYERVLNSRQSISINAGRVSFPKLVSFSTDSFSVKSDLKNSGFNTSIDYRFYLRKENLFMPPHGIYIGPFYSYNHFTRTNSWADMRAGTTHPLVETNSTFNIHTFGAELGYQFILWKRLALDLVLIGPGFSYYDLKATISENLDPKDKERLQKAIKELISQKIPGMNYTFSDKEFNGNGTIRTLSVGYRYIIHIGYHF